MAANTREQIVMFLREHQTQLLAGVVALGIVGFVWKADAGSQTLVFWIALPLLVGALLPIVSSAEVTGKVEGWEQSFENAFQKASRKDGKFARYFQRPLFRGSSYLWRITQPLPNSHVRAGVRMALALYFWLTMIALLFVAAYVIIAVVVLIVILAIVGWILSLQDGRRSGGYSRTIRTFTGRRKQEHYDSSGEKVGESIATTTLLGSPKTEHFDTSGNRVGESRPNTTWTGEPKVEHFDASSNKTGESRPNTTLLGEPIAEHFDEAGHKTGESRERKTLLGETVVEHTENQK